VEVVASLSQGRKAAAQCGLFTYKSVPVIFEPPCNYPLNVPLRDDILQYTTQEELKLRRHGDEEGRIIEITCFITDNLKL